MKQFKKLLGSDFVGRNIAYVPFIILVAILVYIVVETLP
jgi:hypothetical protein